jgi:two-component system sensor histidine kinase AtoS
MNENASDLDGCACPVKLKLMSTDVKALITDSISSVAVPSSIMVRTEVEPSNARLDPAAIKLALADIITNAVQAMPDGGALSIGAAESGGQLQIDIEESHADMRTEGVDGPRTFMNPNGTGAGLMVAKRMVEAHGGRIGIEIDLGRSSRVTIVLPATEEGGRDGRLQREQRPAVIPWVPWRSFGFWTV